MTNESFVNAMAKVFNTNKKEIEKDMEANKKKANSELWNWYNKAMSKVTEYKRPDKWLLHVPVDFAMYRKLRRYAKKNHTSITKTINAAIKLYFYELEENKNDS